jgi:hypothetical protein
MLHILHLIFLHLMTNLISLMIVRHNSRLVNERKLLLCVLMVNFLRRDLDDFGHLSARALPLLVYHFLDVTIILLKYLDLLGIINLVHFLMMQMSFLKCLVRLNLKHLLIALLLS